MFVMIHPCKVCIEIVKQKYIGEKNQDQSQKYKGETF